MQYSVGVEYAFHSLFYMIELPRGNVVGIRALSQLHNVSETYLSKIFTKLKKANIVHSIPGVKGGYELAKSAKDISFWDVVEAVEGSTSLFQCREIRQNNTLNSRQEDFSQDCPCVIKTVMVTGEEKMRDYLKEKSLLWLYQEVYDSFTKDKKETMTTWFKNNSH